MFPDPRSEKGIGLIAAIFVIVMLGMLGTALIALLTTEQRATSREVTSARAFYAAETALQWGMYQVLEQGVGPTDTFPASGPFDGPPPQGLAQCGDLTAIKEAAPDRFAKNVPAIGGAVDLFRFNAVGVCNEDTPVETRRRLEARFGGP